MHEPTGEQQRIIDYEGSAVVSARPGSGKTFTMAKMIAASSRKALSYQGIIAISYTRKASKELEERAMRFGAEKGLSFYGTIDGFCLGEIVSQFACHITGRPTPIEIVDDGDNLQSASAICKPWDNADSDRWDLVKSAIEAGVLPVSAISEAAFCMLKHVPSVRMFVKSRYIAVYVDEYQDCGLAQHLLFKELVSLGLTGVAFGDLDQAIFAYDNRSTDFFEELIASAQFETFEITHNHRCHRSIVDYSLRLLGDRTTRESPEDKRVVRVSINGDESSIARGIAKYIDGICEKYSVESRSEVAILSTSNSMLARYQRLLGFPVKLFSSTKLDTGFSKRRMFFRELLTFLYAVNAYAPDFVERYVSPDFQGSAFLRACEQVTSLLSLNDDKWLRSSALFLDLAEICVPESGDDDCLDDLLELLEDVHQLRMGYRPAAASEVNLLTYHKAKGLEFDIVFCLDTYEYIMPPYHYEKCKYDAYRQSMNTHYVGLTRARKACYIPTATIRHNARGEAKYASPSEFLDIDGLPERRRNVKWNI